MSNAIRPMAAGLCSESSLALAATALIWPPRYLPKPWHLCRQQAQCLDGAHMAGWHSYKKERWWLVTVMIFRIGLSSS